LRTAAHRHVPQRTAAHRFMHLTKQSQTPANCGVRKQFSLRHEGCSCSAARECRPRGWMKRGVGSSCCASRGRSLRDGANSIER
jgi:hypothetical protein